MDIKTGPLRVKAGPEDGLNEGEFLVYPSTFTKTPDSYGDIVAPGAFLESIAEWKASGNTLPGLFGHRLDDPDYFVAGALDQGEDDHGWWVKGAFDLDSPKGKQVYRLVKGKRLNQLSFAYDVLDEGRVELESGETANELRKLRVYEFSFVPVGANQDTSVVAVKAQMDALTQSIKAGRVIPAKSEEDLRKAHEVLGTILAALAAGDVQETASGHTDAKSDEEPSGAKSDEEPRVNPSARALANLHLLSLAEGGRGSS